MYGIPINSRTFEAFYPRESHGIANSVARAPHGHGSFFQHRNPGETNISHFKTLKT